MYNGQLKYTNELKNGDEIMSIKLSPIKISNVINTKNDLYEIKLQKGDSFFLPENGNILINSNKYITINDYLKLNDKDKKKMLCSIQSIDFKENKVEFSPYILGIWLTCGQIDSASIKFTSEIVCEYVKTYFKNIGQKLKLMKGDSQRYYVGALEKKNVFNDFLNKYNLFNNRHIPDHYLFNSNKNRLELLAGILDGKSEVDKGMYRYTNKNIDLVKQIKFLVDSLGFYGNIKVLTKILKGKSYTHYRINISGKELNKIPVLQDIKKINNRTSSKNSCCQKFSIEKTDFNDCVSIILDKDEAILLENLIGVR